MVSISAAALANSRSLPSAAERTVALAAVTSSPAAASAASAPAITRGGAP